MTASSDARPTGPLAGLRVLDISTVVAGPFASTLLADLGAEVLKVEMPGAGDALRRLAPHKDGVPLWWKVTNRNKRGITLDLRKVDGKALLGRLIGEYDVLVGNFRTGTLDEWGITRGWLQSINPRLTILRVTGFGQTGPYRTTPGFARLFEAMSGLTRMCGEEGGTPLHLGYPISDAVGGLLGAIGILAELFRLKGDQEIDCAVTEAMMAHARFPGDRI
jgi:crotonobetainyl-CoA:carnitine CoA-transferase CaiB-like acyl-CoA transferase